MRAFDKFIRSMLNPCSKDTLAVPEKLKQCRSHQVASDLR